MVPPPYDDDLFNDVMNFAYEDPNVVVPALGEAGPPAGLPEGAVNPEVIVAVEPAECAEDAASDGHESAVEEDADENADEDLVVAEVASNADEDSASDNEDDVVHVPVQVPVIEEIDLDPPNEVAPVANVDNPVGPAEAFVCRCRVIEVIELD